MRSSTPALASPPPACPSCFRSVHIVDCTQALLQAYTQAKVSISREHGGSGLGLAIVKHIVDGLKGSVEVSSKVGEGSCFRVFLPVLVPLSGNGLLYSLSSPHGSGSDSKATPSSVMPRFLAAEGKRVVTLASTPETAARAIEQTHAHHSEQALAQSLADTPAAGSTADPSPAPSLQPLPLLTNHNHVSLTSHLSNPSDSSSIAPSHFGSETVVRPMTLPPIRASSSATSLAVTPVRFHAVKGLLAADRRVEDVRQQHVSLASAPAGAATTPDDRKPHSSIDASLSRLHALTMQGAATTPTDTHDSDIYEQRLMPGVVKNSPVDDAATRRANIRVYSGVGFSSSDEALSAPVAGQSQHVVNGSPLRKPTKVLLNRTVKRRDSIESADLVRVRSDSSPVNASELIGHAAAKERPYVELTVPSRPSSFASPPPDGQTLAPVAESASGEQTRERKRQTKGASSHHKAMGRKTTRGLSGHSMAAWRWWSRTRS